MNVHQAKGAAAEHIVIAYFLREAYEVFVRASANSSYDMRVECDGVSLRIEVKTKKSCTPRMKGTPVGSRSGGRKSRFAILDARRFDVLAAVKDNGDIWFHRSVFTHPIPEISALTGPERYSPKTRKDHITRAQGMAKEDK